MQVLSGAFLVAMSCAQHYPEGLYGSIEDHGLNVVPDLPHGLSLHNLLQPLLVKAAPVPVKTLKNYEVAESHLEDTHDYKDYHVCIVGFCFVCFFDWVSVLGSPQVPVQVWC